MSKYNASPKSIAQLNSHHPASAGSHKLLFKPSALCLAVLAAALCSPNIALAGNVVIGGDGKGYVDADGIIYSDQQMETQIGTVGSGDSLFGFRATSGSGNFSGASLTINGTTITYVYGARSYAGSATENIVTINGGTISNSVYGGYSSSGGIASSNTITIAEKSTVSSYIYGGYTGNVSVTDSTASQTVNGNEVSISGSSIRYVAGGYTGNATNNGAGDASIVASSNEVTIDSSTTTSAGWFYGAYTGAAAANGGGDASVTADKNSLEISGGSELTGNISASAYIRGAVTSESGAASVEADGNSLAISGSTLSNTGSSANNNNVAAVYIYGNVTAGEGQDASVTASGNSVTVSESTISGNASANYSNNVAAVYIYGAVTSDGGTASVTATGNSIEVSDSTISGRGNYSSSNSVSGAYVYYGGTSISGDRTEIIATVDGNEVSISGSTVERVYGGAIDGTISASSASGVTITASASHNTISITEGSTVSGNIIGGYIVATGSSSLSSDSSISVTADYNKVSIEKSTITSSIYGGYSNSNRADGTVSYNEIEISNSKITSGSIIAGYASNSTSTSDVTDNKVTLTDITLTGSSVTIAAGYSGGTGREDGTSSKTADNTLTINGGDIEASFVYGGYSNGNSDIGRLTEDNNVYLNGATITIIGTTSLNGIFGGYSEKNGDVTNNTVTVADYTDDKGATITSNIKGDVYGGRNDGTAGTVKENAVKLNSGTITGNVYGGYREYYDSDGESEVANNTVTVSSDVEVDGNVFGGYVHRGGIVTDNEVTLTKGSVSGDVSAAGIGSLSSSSINVATGNIATLNGGTVGGNVNGVYGNHDVYYSYTYNSGNTSPPSSINVQAYTNTTSASSNEVTLNNTEVAGGVYGVNNVIDVEYDVSVNYDSNSDKYTGDNEGKKDTVKDNPFIISADITDNTVTINGGTVEGGVYAASSSINSVYNSSISYTKSDEDVPDITDETATIEVSITNNTIELNGVDVTGDVCGAYSKVESNYESTVTGFVTDNTVTVTVDLEDNTVNLDGGSVTGNIYGAYDAGAESNYSSSSEAGSVSDNTVTVDVKSNTVNVNDGVVKGDTFAAGYSAGSGTVSGNVFNINGGTFSGGYTYAGYSSSGTVSDNILNLNGGTVSGTLYAGYSESGTVQNNIINLDGAVEDRKSDLDVTAALLFGSNLDVTGSNGNTLNIKNYSGRIQNIGYFDTITIDLTGIDIATAVYGQGSVIILTDSDGTGTNLNYSTVNITSSTTYNSLPVVFTSESELSSGYTIVANANGNLTKEGTTITEQILFVQDPNIYENPQYVIYDLMTDPYDDGTISYGTVPEPTPDPGPGPGPTPDPTITSLGGIGNKLNMHYAQLADLRKRLGEIRYGAQDGLWARYVYQRAGYDGVSASSHVKQNLHTLNLGLDHIVSQDESSLWLLGGSFKLGHDNEKVKSAKGKGNLNSYGVDLYATYANQYGCYTDLVLSFDRYHQKIGSKLEDGSSAGGNFNTWGWGASIEVGKMFATTQNNENWGPWHNNWWVEPQAQLSYYWIKGKKWSMDNGTAVNQNNGDSLVGRLGVVVGKQWSYGGATKEDKHYVQAYLKGGVKHEFLGNQKTRINNVKYDHKLRGTTGYYGAGVDWNLTKQVKAYAQVERDAGGRYKKDIEASIGLKWQF